MRKARLIFTVLFLLVFDVNANCSDNFDWTKVCNAICKVETNGNHKAVSKNGRHAGPLQITPTLVKDVNQFLGYKKYTLQDRFNIEKSIEMFTLIQKRYNPTNNIEKAIRIWNGGPGFSKKKTQNYYKKVMKVYYKNQE